MSISDPHEWYPPKAYDTGHTIKTSRFNAQIISYKTSYQFVEKDYPIILKEKNWIPPVQEYTLKDLKKFAAMFSARLVLKQNKQTELDMKVENYEFIMPTYLQLKQKSWIPGMILEGFGTLEDTIFDIRTQKGMIKQNGLKWIPPDSYENEDIKLNFELIFENWCPPMILEGFGTHKVTKFDKGYELKVSSQYPQPNSPKITKRKIPIIGESKNVTQLKDNDGNEISLKIKTGYFWVPDIASKHSLELSIMMQYLKPSVPKKTQFAAYKFWKNCLEIDLKVTEKDIEDAKMQILEVKKSATKIPVLKKLQAKAGLFDLKSDFTYTVATAETGDILSEQKIKISDLLAERKKWIKGLELRKSKIQAYLAKVSMGKRNKKQTKNKSNSRK